MQLTNGMNSNTMVRVGVGEPVAMIVGEAVALFVDVDVGVVAEAKVVIEVYLGRLFHPWESPG